MEGTEIARGLADIAGAAHDGETYQAAARREALSRDRGGQPEQESGQCEAITEQLRRGQPEAVGELPEDAQGAEAAGRPYDERNAHRVAIHPGLPPPVILRRPTRRRRYPP